MATNPKCSFRIIGLLEEQLSNLAFTHLNDTVYRKGSSFKDRSRKTLIIPLNENVKSDLLHSLLADSPDDVYYDFIISIVSDEQSAMVNVPRFVLDLYREVGGEICFSYTCIFDSPT